MRRHTVTITRDFGQQSEQPAEKKTVKIRVMPIHAAGICALIILICAGIVLLRQPAPAATVITQQKTQEVVSRRSVINAEFVQSTDSTVTFTDPGGNEYTYAFDPEVLARQNSVAPDNLIKGDQILVYTGEQDGTAVIERIRFR
ncbi:MAG: hypothetical protein TR69_WS6001000244 [candidate division WS6 bacterium OLB20]|uniref:Uncharacterized protein n=1 Tax=candidate division WS6 bacterium OLB20 TaxID=1617426 RepID=A0A136M0D6_9BACT|nr:MAG: hypothetical protein TR69_WS6001000244 [candidate division WS6 bacterium OLB20]